MIIIYTVPSCSSCKKAEEWLRAHELEYKEVNLLTDDIRKEDLLKILSLTDDGTEEIISKRSKAYARLDLNFNNVTVNDLINIIEDNRTLLRRPLILDDSKLQVGYNEDDIRKFLPRGFRRAKLEQDISEITRNLEDLEVST
ncbi:MAG: Spx/MgsR family RNA polymerase-binding regulatory protein [Streptococcaceae bacterium]|nr:Spx/MgsR family RNA polymerase-binding regulatory protein [Streptococcaceae bacterium]